MESLFIAILIWAVILITAGVVSYKVSQNKYCNSNYNLSDDYVQLKIDEPEYKVHAIQEVYSKNKGPKMAKYVLWNVYREDKDSVKVQELVLYDEVGKYQINDTLKFTKV